MYARQDEQLQSRHIVTNAEW